MAFTLITAHTQGTQHVISSDGDSIVVTEGIYVTRGTDAIVSAVGVEDASVLVDGHVLSDGRAIFLGTVGDSDNDDNFVHVGASGSVGSTGQNTGGVIEENAGRLTLINDGHIYNGGIGHSADGILANGGAATILNHGTISVTPGRLAIFAAAGFNTIENTGTVNGSIEMGSGTVENTGTVAGYIRATSTGSSSTVWNTGVITGGIQFEDGGGAVDNTGTVHWISSAGRATVNNSGQVTGAYFGINLAGDESMLIQNGTVHGRIAVQVTGESSAVVNSGEITATSFDTASGVSLSDDGTRLVNTGTITAMGDAATRVEGVWGLGDGIRVVNHGMISGTVHAIRMSNSGDQTVINRGALNGDVSMGGGADVFRNFGTVDGDIDLGNGQDDFGYLGGNISGSVFGGGGDDTYRIRVAGAELVETGGGGTDRVLAWVDFELSAHIETLELRGWDDLTGIGNGLGNTLSGNRGDNLIRGRGGNDTIRGGDGDDDLRGGAGDDVFDISYDTGTNLIDGGSGTDLLDFSELISVDVHLNQGRATTWFQGDILGTHTISNVEGVQGSFSADVIVGSTGDNMLNGNLGDDRVSGLGGADTILGGSGNDTLNGGGGRDTIEGGADADEIDGGAGIDTIAGGTDNDTMAGGGGADVFVFDAHDGDNQITDFEDGSDQIDVSALNLTFGIAQVSVFQGLGPFVVVSFSGPATTTIRIDGVAVADIDSSDFIF